MEEELFFLGVKIPELKDVPKDKEFFVGDLVLIDGIPHVWYKAWLTVEEWIGIWSNERSFLY